MLYHAKLHPEQYSDTFSEAQLKQLHTSLLHVCQTAVDLLGDSSKFPDEWLFKHRWGKGKKDASTTLPNGSKITFLTVGGRTSCVVPSVQKKTGPVAGDIKKGDLAGKVNGDVEKKAPKSRKRKLAEAPIEPVVKLEDNPASRKGGRKVVAMVKDEENRQEKGSGSKKRKVNESLGENPAKPVSRKSSNKQATNEQEPSKSGRRRSGRISKR